MEDPYSSSLERDANGTILAELFYFSEFAMGAEPVVIVTRRPIHGINTFYTTNGVISRAPDNSCYYIRDSCTVLRINTVTDSLSHWRRPAPYYISRFDHQHDGFYVDLYGGKPYSKSEFHKTIVWHQGFGDVKLGHFPSAHERAIRHIRIPK